MDRRLFLASAAALAACSPAAAPTQAGRTRIRFATDWRAQAEHGGFYQAVADGLYADSGLDVTLIQGGPAVNVPQLIAAGAVEMGMGSSSFMPLNLVQAGAPVRAVMACFQKDPQVLLTHQRADVKSLADIKGKPVMISDASITAMWRWLAAKYGYSDDQIRKYTFNAGPFLADKTAIQQGYVTSEPFTLEKAGVTPQVFLLADAGYPSYGCLALAPQTLIDQNPKAVQSFVTATAEGWRRYLTSEPAKANDLIRKDNPDMPEDALVNARAKLVDYGIVMSGDAKDGAAIGAMTDARWSDFFTTMAGVGVYPKDLDVKTAYSLAFVGGPA
jgi:NitT/TauT family transport system substrate-binding protein